MNPAYAKELTDGRPSDEVRVATWRRQADKEALAEARDVTIVGVVDQPANGGTRAMAAPPPRSTFRRRLARSPRSRSTCGAGAADAIAPAIRDIVNRVDARVPIAEMGSLASVNELSMGPSHWLTRMSALLGVIALLLAAAGLFATASYAVTHRAREFAVAWRSAQILAVC